MTDLVCRLENSTGRITLNRPGALNALTHEMCLGMAKQLEAWAKDEVVTQVLVDAEGEKAFCAGGDIQSLYDHGKKGDFTFSKIFFANEYHLNKTVAMFPKPYIVFMQGFTMGGGVGIACHGSHRIVCETTRIAMPECGIGLIPDVGGSLLLATSPGHIGEYLGLTGARMEAGDAIHAGFADQFVPAKGWEGLKAELVENTSRERIVEIIREAGAAAPPAGLQKHEKIINDAFAAPDVAGIIERLQALKRRKFAASTLEALGRQSPLSMAACLAVVRAVCEYPEIDTAFDWEYRVTSRSSEHGDFLEGVRAAIIDKDRNPAWRHGSIADVTDEELAVLLAPVT